MKLNT